MNRRVWTKKRQCWMFGILCASVLCAWYLVNSVSVHSPQHSNPPLFEAPQISTSRFANASPLAVFVGTEACVDCHDDQYRTYLQTAHSQTLSDIDLTAEPPDGEFFHAPSGRTYRVYRKGNQLRHRESVRTRDGEELVLSDFPMRYVIGSGRHSRSYIVETDGFLVESPVTWYASGQQWGMSPGAGYEDSDHWAFERATDSRCLICHVGRVDSVDGSFHRLKIPEQNIGCERCHGPGSLHIQRWNSGDQPFSDGDQPFSDGDLTIVHPGRLSRERNEAICAQCHLSGAVVVDVRNRKPADFRPSLPLDDFCIAYHFETTDKSMTVVGHVEQMRLSRCYQASDTLTCTTCHSLHAKPTPDERLVFYRNKCLACHTDQECGLMHEERIRENPQDNCVACHMPQVPTDIPHFAFTHHRIQKNRPQQSTGVSAAEPGNLVPLDDISHLPRIEQDRCLGLAYWQLSVGTNNGKHAATFSRRARDLLESVRMRGLSDPEVDAALASCYGKQNPRRAIKYAESAAASSKLSPASRIEVLWILGSSYFDLNETNLAIPPLEELVRLHRNAEAWLLLDVCHYRAGNKGRSLEAARRAAQISPYRPDLQARLADLYRQTGNDDLSEKHSKRKMQLLKLDSLKRK